MCGLLLQFYTAVLQITCWFILHHKQVSAMLWVIHVGVMWMSRMGRIVDFSLINKNSFGKWDINSRVIFLFCAGRKYCVWWKGRNGYFWHNVNEPIEAI